MKYQESQAGYSAVGVLVTISLLGVLIMIMSQQSRQMEQLAKPIALSADLMDLRHYIRENFSCVKTNKFNSCNDQIKKVNTYGKNGGLLTSTNGTLFYKFEVTAECYDLEYHLYFKNKNGEFLGNKQHLFDSIPIVCRNYGTLPL